MIELVFKYFFFQYMFIRCIIFRQVVKTSEALYSDNYMCKLVTDMFCATLGIVKMGTMSLNSDQSTRRIRVIRKFIYFGTISFKVVMRHLNKDFGIYSHTQKQLTLLTDIFKSA